MSHSNLAIDASRIDESLQMLKQHLSEEDIAPLIAVLEDLVDTPRDSTLLQRLSEAFQDLKITQGAVLTYAPYLAIVLSHDPTNQPD